MNRKKRISLNKKKLLLLLQGVERKTDDQTQLLSALQWTELAGTVSMLYGMLLHQVITAEISG
jgi:hypothetical protein